MNSLVVRIAKRTSLQVSSARLTPMNLLEGLPLNRNLQNDMIFHIKSSGGGEVAASNLIREARRANGLSQRSVAQRAGIAQPAIADIERSAHDPCVATLDRLLAATGFTLTALPTFSWTVSRWADFLYQELRGSRQSQSVLFRAIIGVSDELRAAEPCLRVALCVAEPACCGDLRYDAALAAVVEHHLTVDLLPVPPWVNKPSRFLKDPWRATPDFQVEELLPAFQRHGILLSASELESI